MLNLSEVRVGKTDAVACCYKKLIFISKNIIFVLVPLGYFGDGLLDFVANF